MHHGLGPIPRHVLTAQLITMVKTTDECPLPTFGNHVDELTADRLPGHHEFAKRVSWPPVDRADGSTSRASSRARIRTPRVQSRMQRRRRRSRPGPRCGRYVHRD